MMSWIAVRLLCGLLTTKVLPPESILMQDGALAGWPELFSFQNCTMSGRPSSNKSPHCYSSAFLILASP